MAYWDGRETSDATPLTVRYPRDPLDAGQNLG
jgi:hypothetical protein